MAVLIKRYANRKLYNTVTSRYITLKGIAELLEQGEDVRVIDNETGDDITSVALSQILVDSERTKGGMKGTVLTELIQRGGDVLYGALRRGVDDASESIDEFQRNVRRVIRRDREEGEVEGEPRPSLGARLSEATDVERMVQRSVERVLKLLDLPRRSDIDALNRNLERVAHAIEGMQRPSSAKPPPPPARDEPSSSSSSSSSS